MRFSFDERQLEFRAQMRAWAEKECTASDVRQAWSSPPGWSHKRWISLAQMGVVGLTVPESFGGLGLGLVDLVLLLEEAGRACLPEPLIETAALGVPLLVESHSDHSEALRAEWLTRVSEGEAVLAVGVAPARVVTAAAGAHLLLLEHRAGEVIELHALRADTVQRTPVRGLDGTRAASAIDWEPSRQTLLAGGEEALRLIARTGDRAATATGAMLLGVADRMISMAAQYAVERKQFGKPIGSFQAVKHHLANALVRLEFARPVVYRAAWSCDSDLPEATVHASMAKAQASEAALVSARAALQVHGAIGYTWEHDLHLWMKRAWSLARAWGDAAHHRARVLEALVAPDL